MSRKGGYQIIDLSKITSSPLIIGENTFNVKGIYNSLKTTNKVILLSGLKIIDEDVRYLFRDLIVNMYAESDVPELYVDTFVISSILKMNMVVSEYDILTINISKQG